MGEPSGTPPPRRAGPWIIKFNGLYAFGRRARVEVGDVRVIDLSSTPDQDEDSHSSYPAHRAYIEEDVEPKPGLDVDLGDQTLTVDEFGDWTVVSRRD